MGSQSWFAKYSECLDCGYPVVVTQSPTTDYWWYCSNKMCKNHQGIELGDMEGAPDWVRKEI